MFLSSRFSSLKPLKITKHNPIPQYFLIGINALNCSQDSFKWFVEIENNKTTKKQKKSKVFDRGQMDNQTQFL
jgi:hypothetical protein